MSTLQGGQSNGLEAMRSKTKAVKVEIELASDHAAVIGTVLAQELPEELQVGEVAQAIEQTGDLEQRLAQSAETLADVSAELQCEIEKRRAAADELTASRADVERLSDQLLKQGKA